jgi:hypothetical protein
MTIVRPEVSGRRSGPPNSFGDQPNSTGPPKSTEDRDAYSIEEFCLRHGISHGTYYNLKALGLGPREGRAMTRVLISRESAADWRKQIEMPTNQAAADEVR